MFKNTIHAQLTGQSLILNRRVFGSSYRHLVLLNASNDTISVTNETYTKTQYFQFSFYYILWQAFIFGIGTRMQRVPNIPTAGRQKKKDHFRDKRSLCRRNRTTVNEKHRVQAPIGISFSRLQNVFSLILIVLHFLTTCYFFIPLPKKFKFWLRFQMCFFFFASPSCRVIYIVIDYCVL